MSKQNEVNFKDSLKDLMEDYPIFLKASHLVELGIYSSKSAVLKAKFRNVAPPSIKISENRVRFLKKDLINWLESQKETFSISV